MVREEAYSKLFKFDKQWRFFLVYSLMIKCSSFSRKLQIDLNPHPPPSTHTHTQLQFSSKEYIEKNMASCPIFTFETTKNIKGTKAHIAEEPNVYLFENNYVISLFRQLLK